MAFPPFPETSLPSYRSRAWPPLILPCSVNRSIQAYHRLMTSCTSSGENCLCQPVPRNNSMYSDTCFTPFPLIHFLVSIKRACSSKIQRPKARLSPRDYLDGGIYRQTCQCRSVIEVRIHYEIPVAAFGRICCLGAAVRAKYQSRFDDDRLRWNLVGDDQRPRVQKCGWHRGARLGQTFPREG